MHDFSPITKALFKKAHFYRLHRNRLKGQFENQHVEKLNVDGVMNRK